MTKIKHQELLQIERVIIPNEPSGKLLAFISASYGILDFRCSLVDGPQGPFLSFPARQASNGRWYNHIYMKDQVCLKYLESEAIAAFEATTKAQVA